MARNFDHIVGANGTGEPTPETADNCVLFRTSSWQIAEAQDGQDSVAIFGQTAQGTIGLEFPKSEAKALVRQLAAMMSPSPSKKQ